MVLPPEVMLKRCSKEIAQREHDGYKWFGVETKITDEGIMIPIFKGKTFPQYNGIDGNEEWIKKLVKFYIAKWRKDKFCVHGDLALCNIIFTDVKDTIHIIDWEHFHYNKRDFFGFDIVNMLFIHLQYQYRWWSYWGWNWVAFVKPRHKDFIAECIAMLGNEPLLKTPFTNAAVYIKKFMDKDKFILGKQSPERLESLDCLSYLNN